jgi:ketosteroid isomerase-like protein
VTVVRHAFAALAGRDLDTVLKLCDPDVVPRPHPRPPPSSPAARTRIAATGMRAYAHDIRQVGKSLELTPTAFRAADHSVIVFGRADSRSETRTNTVYALWV